MDFDGNRPDRGAVNLALGVEDVSVPRAGPRPLEVPRPLTEGEGFGLDRSLPSVGFFDC